MTNAQIITRLQTVLTTNRFAHSLGVAETAHDLALHYGADAEKAYLAGLLHDCSKYLSDKQMLDMALSQSLPVDPIERINPELLHAKLSAFIASGEYRVSDGEILIAIRRHISGATDMSLLDLLVNVADYIEPNRSFSGVDVLRTLAWSDPYHALTEAFRGTMAQVLADCRMLHPATVETYNSLLMRP